ncbi:hypothetical protein Smp_164310 [Schistosoma mansoni]|uniref:hypothetical protein n=1 Tax=Schistosoma mansoni TaxID=6183 RepID=UPI0001A6261E|nr:hypothetical protein Smp_164310 [Schistosoma mansoni]|eukprot:XP_018646966.1 hypothetical protein Smp_164310 [Schistosoma mansoni]
MTYGATSKYEAGDNELERNLTNKSVCMYVDEEFSVEITVDNLAQLEEISDEIIRVERYIIKPTKESDLYKQLWDFCIKFSTQ